MTWDAFAALTGKKTEIWLCELTVGGVTTYHTPRARAYTYNSIDYQPEAIVKRNIPTTGSERRAEMQFTIPRSNAFAASVVNGLGVKSTRVRVLHGFKEDTDQQFVTKFDGRVVGFSAHFGKGSLGRVNLRCEEASPKAGAGCWPEQ